jgi:nondiscriminating glutamyl-tRNA synthetase
VTEPAVVRFAPSPTGPPHLGNLRTALFDWLVARASGGRFIVRIEDTDQARRDAQAEAQMLSALRWLGLDWDEGPDIGGPHGPYRQSERLGLYAEAADRLIAAGDAYRCTCSTERVEIVQKRLRAQGKMAVYDNHCRDLGIGPTDAPHVIRFKMPLEGSLTFHDLVRGEIRFDVEKLAGDMVLVKSDGFPTYHLAMAVDDHAMEITHVIRGEEWIPSTPLHMLLFAALGWDAPRFAHLPLVTDKSGKKIKKREPGFQASTYQEGGYLPEAVANALAFLGWHPGTTDEVFSRDELIARFSLNRISKSPAAFDEDKLRWFARRHMARLSLDALADLVIPLIEAEYPGAAGRDRGWLLGLVAALREDLVTLNDAVPAAHFAFEAGPITPEARGALSSEQARPVLEALRDKLRLAAALDAEGATALFKDLRTEFKVSHGWAGAAVMFPPRAALTGSTSGPHLADVLLVLGKDESLRRVESALAGLVISDP